MIAVAPLAVAAQAQAPAPAPQTGQLAVPAVPDPLVLSKLLWSTMAAIDHANKTGNYTVLHALGSAAFRRNNSPASLANIFAGIRASRIDLADTFLLEPRLEFPPTIQAGLLRMRGAFRMRPLSTLLRPHWPGPASMQPCLYVLEMFGVELL
jgi:hypothetical protein